MDEKPIAEPAATTNQFTPEPTLPTPTPPRSPEAIIGTGVTIAALGVLFLLLGWAQAMRHVQPASGILLGIGAVCVVIGGVIAAMAPKKSPRGK